jgi:hypothetical protein
MRLRHLIIALVLLLVSSAHSPVKGATTPNTIAELLSLDPALYPNPLYCAGYYAAGDGGGGFFKGTTSTSEATNYGTVFAPVGSTGRWIRRYSGAVSPLWFGAMDDGTTDHTTRLQSMVNTAELGQRLIEFPPSTNGWVTSGLRVTNHVGLTFTGNRSKILHKFDHSRVIYAPLTNSYAILIQDDCDYSSVTGFDFVATGPWPNGDASNSGGNVFITVGQSSYCEVSGNTFKSGTHMGVTFAGLYFVLDNNDFIDCGFNSGLGYYDNLVTDGEFDNLHSTFKRGANHARVTRNHFHGGTYKKFGLISGANDFFFANNTATGIALTGAAAKLPAFMFYVGDVGFTDDSTNTVFQTNWTGTIENNRISGTFLHGIEVRSFGNEANMLSHGNPFKNTNYVSRLVIQNNTIDGGIRSGMLIRPPQKLDVIRNNLTESGSPVSILNR